MAGRKDPYEVLGVARDADEKAIQTRFRKLAREHHPDLNPDDEAAETRFKEVTEAHRVLSDPELRSNYDEFGEIALETGFDAEAARHARDSFGSGFGRGQSFETGFGRGGLEDLFGQMFSGGGRREAGGFAMPGHDAEARLELEFVEAAFGGEKSLTLTRAGVNGSSAPETIKVRIPAGVDSGGRLRIPGKGGPGIGGGPPGDLWVTLRVRPHPFFQRDGSNLSLDLPITVTEAIRGADIVVPTLDSTVVLTVPPGTSSGTRLRLKKKGIRRPGGAEPGDLFVRVQIRVPQDLDESAEAALDELARFEEPEPRSKLGV